jgi:hypothetical protein
MGVSAVTTDERQTIPVEETVKRIMQEFRFRRMQNMVGNPESITNESLVPEELSRHAEAAEIVKAVLAALPSQAQADGWQDIASAPKDGTKVLVSVAGRQWITIAAHATHGYRGHAWREIHSLGRVTHYEPTHWRPLPAPPVIAEQREVK